MKVRQILERVEPQWLPNKDYETYQPKVTVVLPTFRRAKSGYFEKAVESVIAQKYTNWELIIVDDASTDGTFDLINFFMELDGRISCIRHTCNLGLPAISQYEAYCKARGEYIAYIFDDNVWDENHLYWAMKAMIRQSTKFTYGIARNFDDNDNFSDIAFELYALPITNCIGNGAVVLHKDVIETVGLYDPHLSLTRLCDWDLWRRIYRKFYMYKVDEVVTREYGVTLDDSLGNTVEMNVWIALEQMSENRNQALLPENFEEYDIIDIPPCSSELFSLFSFKFYNNYINKIWFESMQEHHSAAGEKKKRVLLVLSCLDATYSIGFEHYFKNAVFRIISFADLSEKDLPFCDAIIYVREAALTVKLLEKFKKYRIPSYFYLDDNFLELAKTNKRFTEVSDSLKSESMKLASKIIVSTEKLKSDFEENGIHDNIVVLPPCYEFTDHKMNFSKDRLNIAFMGGEFREKSFVDIIYPALAELSADKVVKLVCPESLVKKIRKRYLDNRVELVGIERDICYNQVLARYKIENVHLLLHSGEASGNNRYKTLNALLNAYELGAVLICSDIEPYSAYSEIMKVKNTKRDWKNAIEEIAFDENKRKKQYEAAKILIQKNYALEVVDPAFGRIVEAESTSITASIARYETALLNAQFTRFLGEPKQNDIFIDKCLGFSALGGKPVSYKIRPYLEQFSKIALIFSSDFASYRGHLDLELYDGRNQFLEKMSIDMEDIVVRQLTFFDFKKKIRVSGNMTVKLTAYYEGSDKTKIGVYENRLKKHLLHKVLNKTIGTKILTRDLLYYELY